MSFVESLSSCLRFKCIETIGNQLFGTLVGGSDDQKKKSELVDHVGKIVWISS